ncbi:MULTISPECIES: hypothetical protein [Calothrix]|nr:MULTISPECIES: hypothetical protein [Calothrix]
MKKIEEQIVEFWAWREIAKGEEITINYNGNPEDNTPIWFEPVE